MTDRNDSLMSGIRRTVVAPLGCLVRPAPVAARPLFAPLFAPHVCARACRASSSPRAAPFALLRGYGHAGTALSVPSLAILVCSAPGADPVMLAANTPSEMRALISAADAVDQLSPAAEAPALVSTRIGRLVRLWR